MQWHFDSWRLRHQGHRRQNQRGENRSRGRYSLFRHLFGLLDGGHRVREERPGHQRCDQRRVLDGEKRNQCGSVHAGEQPNRTGGNHEVRLQTHLYVLSLQFNLIR